MRTYIAATKNSSYTNGWFNCLKWAQSEVESSGAIIKIHVARPEVKTARIVAEVTTEGIRVINNGRYVTLRSLGGVMHA